MQRNNGGDEVGDVLEIDSLLQVRDEKEKRKRTRAKSGTPKAKSVKKITKKEQQIIDMANNTILPEYYETVWTEEQLDELCAWIKRQEFLAIDTETLGVNPFADEIVGISFYAPHKGWYIPLKHKDDVKITLQELHGDLKVGIDYVKCLDKALVSEKLKPLLENPKLKLLLHNAKFDMHVLHNWMNIDIIAYFDTMIGQALLDENQSKKLKDIAPYYLHIAADKFSTLFGKVTFDRVPILMNEHTRTGSLASYYAIKDTELTFRMFDFQRSNLERPHLKEIKKLMYELEMPFIKVAYDAEQRGVPLDVDYLEKTVAPKLHEELEALRQQIWEFTGKINLNSPKQKSEAIYVKLKLPQVNPDKPTSTDKKTLKRMLKAHPVIPLLLEYSEKVKLTTAFADKLPKLVIEGLVHTSFNTVGTKTGRMSCNNPNLQQIPAKVGGLIRNAFVAPKGRLLVSVDFSSQELRVLAHVSKDPVLLDIYKNGKDVHSMTGTGMWNMQHPDQQVTYEYFQYCRGMTEKFQDEDGNIVEERFSDVELLNKLHENGDIDTLDVDELKKQAQLGKKFDKTRKSAKTVNFGIIYGMSAKGLSDQLDVSEEEAQIYIDGYFASYPGVKKWMKEQEAIIKKVYYTTTMLGRKRRVHREITSGKRWLVSKGVRQAINAIIQGSSADMVKTASLLLIPYLKTIDSHIVLWVHDEIIFDVPENIGMEKLQGIADIMCNAIPLDCGLKSDIEAGVKWGQKLSEDALEALHFREEYYAEESEGDEEEEGDEPDAV